jgi:hypothetical protein
MPYRNLVPDAATLLPMIRQIEADARALAGGLTSSQLNWRPPDGGWGVAQVLTHVVLSNRIYYPVFRRLLEENPPVPGASAATWRPSMFGRLLISSLVPTNTRKIPTSGKLKPGPEPVADALGAFLESYREVADYVRQAEGRDLIRMKFVSPVSPLVRGLNFGDGLVILVVHGQRHLKQIERVKASPGFPSSPA